MKVKYILLLTVALMMNPLQVVAKEPNLKEVEMTYYTDKGLAADNKTQTREGICAFQKKYIGMTAIIYENNNGKPGDIVGIYEVCDTGYGRTERNGKGTIQNGNCVDVFFSDDAKGKEFIQDHGNKVLIQFVEAEG